MNSLADLKHNLTEEKIHNEQQIEKVSNEQHSTSPSTSKVYYYWYILVLQPFANIPL